MRLLDVTLLLQFIAKVNVCHFGKLQAQPALCTAVQVFNDPQASKKAVAAAGEAFLCVVYGGKIDDNLDVKRHQLYLRTIAKQKVCAKFDWATLPPTSAAARQHSFRVYHQVQQWRGVALNRTDWGWRLKDGRPSIYIDVWILCGTWLQQPRYER